jgi:hypothetical protein
MTTNREQLIANEAMCYMKSYIVEIMRSHFDGGDMTEMNDRIRAMIKEVIEDHYLGEDRIREICQEEVNNIDLEDQMREIAQEEVSGIDIDTLLAGKTVTIRFE